MYFYDRNMIATSPPKAELCQLIFYYIIIIIAKNLKSSESKYLDYFFPRHEMPSAIKNNNREAVVLCLRPIKQTR